MVCGLDSLLERFKNAYFVVGRTKRSQILLPDLSALARQDTVNVIDAQALAECIDISQTSENSDIGPVHPPRLLWHFGNDFCYRVRQARLVKAYALAPIEC